MKTQAIIFLLCSAALAGCETLEPKAPDITLDEEPFIEAVYLSKDDQENLVDEAQPAAQPIVWPPLPRYYMKPSESTKA